MADEPDNLVLTILRELQADMAAVKRDLGEVLLQQNDMREETTYALGMIVASNRKLDQAHKRIDEVVNRLEKLEAH